jgi:hypothetical protein
MNHPTPTQFSLVFAGESGCACPVNDKEQAAADLRQLLTDIFVHQEPAQRLMAIGHLVPAAHRMAWYLVTHTLLARRLSMGSPQHLQVAADSHTLAWALSRLWEQPTLQLRWQRLVGGMTVRQCGQLASRARRHLARRTVLH